MRIFSVTELTSSIKILLEENFSFIWINGEISNFSKPSSGHYYFSLKDSRSQISAVMFHGQNRRLTFLPENGMQITALGRLSVYEPRGTYQIIIEHLEPKGIGALQIAFEQLKEKLKNEGLFDIRHKRPIPLLPNKITVITSPTGAVVHDIIKIATRRFPNICITIIPVSVQGSGAENEIVNAINLLNSRKDADLAIIARGGGSLEDLQAFNSESVARAVFSSDIPIVSAIGHESDYTIIDFISDLRAPTPSSAAEIVVPDKTKLLNLIHAKQKFLEVFFRSYIEKKRSSVTQATDRLIDPKRKIQDFRIRTDDLLNRMIRSFSYNNQRLYDKLEFVKKRLYSNPLAGRLHSGHISIDGMKAHIRKNLLNSLQKKRSSLQEVAGKLNALSPVSILNRGYSITRTKMEKKIISDAGLVSIGQHLEIILAKGMLNCIVEGEKLHVKEDV
ncbi:MAG: exodeoxyribonuclease VII large subunit [Deltaproteobacteria bacterium]|nr:MAG: exodeoxyribonuclease VII large subunit [Deltaproteobacteria bacterium]